MTAEPDTYAYLEQTVAHIERTARPLLDYQSDAIPPDVYKSGLRWLQEFIMKPHPKLGRSGAVCPFAQFSYSSGALWATAADVNEISFATFVQFVLRLPEVYGKLLTDNALSRTLFSLIIFFPNLDIEKYSRFLDLTQAIAKPVFMDSGLMLGEFHPASETAGVHSAQFHPMRSDVPAFVVRSIAPHDALFIDRANTPNSFRLNELECFLKWSAVTDERADHLRKRIDELRGGAVENAPPAAPGENEGARL